MAALTLDATWVAPHARLWLHRSTYVQGGTVVDWSKQSGPLLQRRLDYLVQPSLSNWETYDEEQMRQTLAAGWQRDMSRFKQARLNACRLHWRRLGQGFYYVWNSC